MKNADGDVGGDGVVLVIQIVTNHKHTGRDQCHSGRRIEIKEQVGVDVRGGGSLYVVNPIGSARQRGDSLDGAPGCALLHTKVPSAPNAVMVVAVGPTIRKNRAP